MVADKSKVRDSKRVVVYYLCLDLKRKLLLNESLDYLRIYKNKSNL